MTEAKHTPGPWRWTDTEHPYSGVRPELLGANDRPVFTGGGDHYHEAYLNIQEANARLIAAAPELLESLQHAVQIIRKYVPADALGIDTQGGGDGWNDQSWPILDEYLHTMDAAIAKATGAA